MNENNIRRLAKDVLATVVYYDIFDYPVTAFEIWKHLLTVSESNEKNDEISLGEIVCVLEIESVRKNIVCDRGFYFLHDRKGLVLQRLRRGKIAIAKLQGVARLVSVMRFFPFVRMVALTGSLAMHNSDKKGDWDMLIVLRSGHIWTGRAIATALLHLFGKRRHADCTTDRACLNYWITDTTLEAVHRDLFTASEYSFALPLFGEKLFRKFQLQNGWIRRFQPEFLALEAYAALRVPDTRLSVLARNVGEVLLSDALIERLLSVWQKKKIAKNPKTHLPDSFIVANDERLIFWPNPKGPRIFDAFQKRLSGIESEL